MAVTQFGADARHSRRYLIRVLTSAALTVPVFASAFGQMSSAPSSSPSGGAATNAPAAAAPADAAPAPDSGATLGPPTLRLSGLRFFASGQLTETYSNNVLGVPSGALGGYKGTDVFTTVMLNLGVHDHTARLDADLAYGLSGAFYANNSGFNRIYNSLNAVVNATLVPERWFAHASAAAAPILINRLGALGAPGTNTGLRDSYPFSVSSDLRLRFGNLANSVSSVGYSSVIFAKPTGNEIDQTVPGIPNAPGNLASYGATESLSGGAYFYRLSWGATGSYNKWTQPGLDFETTTGVANLRYAFSRAVSVAGQGGYSFYSSSQQLNQSISGVFGLAGLQYTPTPDISIQASAGWQYGNKSYIGSLTYQIGALTSISGSLTDSVGPSAGRLLNGLGSLGVNGAGAFYNTNYQLNALAPPTSISNVSAFNPSPIDGTSITTEVVRYRSASLSWIHISDRMQYRLTGYGTIYDTLTPVPSGTDPHGTSTGVVFAASRAMTPRLNGGFEMTYGMLDDLAGQFAYYQGAASLNYSLSRTIQTYFSASYLRRDSGDALSALSNLSGSVSSVSLSIGISKQFL